MTLPLYIFEERYRKMVRECVEHSERRIVLTLAQPSPQISDSTELQSIVYVGSYVDILSVMENADGSFHILTHGQGRCRVKPSRSEAVSAADGAVSYLHYTEDEPYPLGRSDPNSERLAAWDALAVFNSYAERFFADTAREQLEEALPDDLLFQASFICANLRLAATTRQTLLEAPTLIERFSVAERLMREQLEPNPEPTETAG